MTKLKIQTGSDNPVLRKESEKIENFAKLNVNFGDFVKGMRKTLVEQKGLGLAAPQVGENVRVILCRMDAGTDREVLFVMVNPEIVEMSASAEELAGVNAEVRKRGKGSGDGKAGKFKKGGGDDSAPFGIEVGEEGCLSLPGQYIDVARASSIVVKFKDGRVFLKGGGRGWGVGGGGGGGRAKKASDLGDVELGLHGMNARVVQHEVDHLNGVLICDKGA